MIRRDIQVVGHRGDPYRERENTLASFESALRAGADAVELDVRHTADGVPVVLHDATLSRLWGVERAVADLSLAELNALTGDGVPTLRQALAATFPARVLVDLPEPGADTARLAVETVREDGSGGRVYYCGDPAALRAVRRLDADAEIALTWKRPTPIRRSLLDEVRPAWLNYRFGLLNRPVVQHARERGYLVSAWTLDSPRAMRWAADLGVDAITTNRAAALCAVLGRPATPPRPSGP